MSSSRAITVVAIGVVAGAVAGAVAARVEGPRYTTRAVIAAAPPGATGGAFPIDAQLSAADRVLRTDARLVRLGPVVDRAVQRLPAGTDPNVKDQVQADPVKGSVLLEVSAVDRSRDAAARIANAFADALVEYRRDADTGRLSRAGGALEQRLEELEGSNRATAADRRAIHDRLAAINAAAALAHEPLTVVAAASPGDATRSYSWISRVPAGAIAGLVLALVGLLVLGRLRSRRVRVEDLPRAHDLPLIAMVPRYATLRTPLAGDTLPADVSAAADRVVDSLRASAHRRSAALVTSAARFEGRSTISLVLGRTLAHRGMRVLVVEADIANPKLADRSGAAAIPGLVQVAAGSADLEDAVHEVDLLDGANGSLCLINAGDRVAAPEQFLASPGVHRLLGLVHEMFNVVLIDPPAGYVGAALTDRVDHVVVVSRPGMARPRQIAEFARRLRSAHDGSIAGLVLNHIR